MTTTPRPFRPGRPLAVLAALAAALGAGACGDAAPAEITGGIVGDATAPSLAVDPSAGDTVLAVRVSARDNLGLRRVVVRAVPQVEGRRDTIVALDTTFTSAVTDFSQRVAFAFPASVRPWTEIVVLASAVDGAGNQGAAPAVRGSAGNVPLPRVAVTAPSAGSPYVIGKSGTLSLSASSRLKVRVVGYTATGSFAGADSTILAEPLRDTVAVLDTLVVPATAPAGVVTITPFVIDSIGRRVTGTPVAFAVQPVTAITTPSVVTFGSTRRVEVQDTVRVSATHPTGILRLGYEVVDPARGDAVIAADSVALNGQLTLAERTFTWRLPITQFPRAVRVRAFAVNGAQRRGYATLANDAVRADTAVVVAGLTRPLPSGGTIADGLYVPRYDRLYLTNIERNQLEVFSLADTSFKRAIVVGSRPWGIAPWPRDREGTMGDTLLVANSGGTNISYVRLDGDGSGAEAYRYPLPNIIAYSVTTEKQANTGAEMQMRTIYDFSDRPQYVAATCETRTSAGGACGDVVLVYSTTPTGGQSVPFPNKGTLRWENLSRCTSHFFFEQAVGQERGRADTLEIVRFSAHPSYRLPSGCAAPEDSTVLLPYRQLVRSAMGDSGFYSVVVRLPELGFRDTTFARNSGNFARAVLGEGGLVRGSRAMTYTADAGFQETFPWGGTTWAFSVPIFDLGVSRAKDVSDFIANAFAQVRGVAINFDGALSAIRGDSTYIIDPQLRLQGLMQTSGGQNAGFDFHPRNASDGSMTPDVATRLAFSASAEPRIEIFDTYCYQKLGDVEIRDPIVGPIKASQRPDGSIVLVGASARGVVVVPITRPPASGCTPSARGAFRR